MSKTIASCSPPGRDAQDADYSACSARAAMSARSWFSSRVVMAAPTGPNTVTVIRWLLKAASSYPAEKGSGKSPNLDWRCHRANGPSIRCRAL